MLTKGVKFTNFKIKKNSLLIKKKLISLLKSKNEILNSLSQNYKDNFTKKILLKYKRNTNYRVIGMGGSLQRTDQTLSLIQSTQISLSH